jgi:acyl-CoA-binding protein
MESNRVLLVVGAGLLLAGAIGLAYYHSSRTIKSRSSEVVSQSCSIEFNAAVEESRKLNIMDTGILLKLYGLYKRATVGKAEEANKPWEPTARAKWHAWHDCRDLSKEEAETLYIDYIRVLQGSNKSEKVSMGPKVSKMAVSPPELIINAPEVEFEGMKQFDDAREDFSKLREHLDAHPSLVQCQDEEKRTLLHWAVDSDDLDAVMLLLERGSAIDVKDSEGFTPLGYAASSDLFEIATLLYEAGANVMSASTDKPAYELTRNAELKARLKATL